MNLSQLVIEKINTLGREEAGKYFDVSQGTLSAWANGKSSPSILAAQKVLDETTVPGSDLHWGCDDKPLIQVLLPIYRYPHPLNHITLLLNYKKYGPEKVNIIPRFRTLIDEARNDLIHKAMETKSEWFVMIDEDMVMPVGSASALHKHGFNVPQSLGNRLAFERLMSHPKEYRIVGCLYRDRRGSNKAQCAKGFGSPRDNERLVAIMDGKSPDSGIEEAGGWTGTGVIRIHRSVFEEMIEASKPGGPLTDIAPPPERSSEPYGFFGRSSYWRGEDVAFGRRAEKIGIKSYIDTGLYCGHEGSRIF